MVWGKLDANNTIEKNQTEQTPINQSKNLRTNVEPFSAASWISLDQFNNGKNDDSGLSSPKKTYRPELDESYDQTIKELKKTVRIF